MGSVLAGLEAVGQMQPVRGFQAVGVRAGMKKNGSHDLTLIVADRDCAAAAVFTTNQSKAAPVLISQEHLAAMGGRMRAVVINTTSANAMTGRVGLENSRTMARMVAERLNVDYRQVLVMSTGVIGTHLPMPRIQHGIELAFDHLAQDWATAAQGIMTTDTRPKVASTTVHTMDGEYTITGISKGAGMIAPNMATMLAVIVTDAGLSRQQAQQALLAASDHSFNRIVVDGDTSTNDTVALLASGASGCQIRTDADAAQFTAALMLVAQSLAQQIVRDGEGATKFITLHVTGAESDQAAHRIANTIATSPLVKTAFYGGDANWGRIVAAAGRAGVLFDPDRARLHIAAGQALPEDAAPLLLFADGMPTRYSEEEATRIFRQPEVYVWLELGLGSGQATVWTCDLSHEYVSINGDYRS
jgi:glutamate N-acetyltransferase/amino-acid N-acetyltransferase